MTLPDYLRLYYDWTTSSGGINPPLWDKPSDEELVEHRSTIKQKARVATWVLGIAAAAALLGAFTTEGGSLGIFLTLALPISLTGFMGAYLVRSSPWLLSSNFWREMYLHEPIQETLGSQLVKAPFATAGNLLLFIVATTFGFMIERDIETILNSADPNGQALTDYILNAAWEFVSYGTLFYLIYTITVTPFRIHKLYTSDPRFAERHGVTRSSIWLRPFQSYLVLGLAIILVTILIGVASILFG